MRATLATLRQAQVYIIVSPDIPARTEPHYMQPEDRRRLRSGSRRRRAGDYGNDPGTPIWSTLI